MKKSKKNELVCPSCGNPDLKIEETTVLEHGKCTTKALKINCINCHGTQWKDWEVTSMEEFQKFCTRYKALLKVFRTSIGNMMAIRVSTDIHGSEPYRPTISTYYPWCGNSIMDRPLYPHEIGHVFALHEWREAIKVWQGENNEYLCKIQENLPDKFEEFSGTYPSLIAHHNLKKHLSTIHAQLLEFFKAVQAAELKKFREDLKKALKECK